MAKKSTVEKMLKKQRLIEKHSKKREELSNALLKAESFEERMLLQKKMEALPLNSCKVRHRNRCWLTGRPRGYHRDLGLCRNALRLMAHQGLVPGLRKASW